MHVCVVSFKPCWQRPDGTWVTDGGFPLQMAAITAMFDDATLVVVRTAPRAGGLPLPSRARIVGLDSPVGADARRKVSMLGRLPRYVRQIVPHVRAADVVHVPLPGDVSALGLLIALASRKRLIARYGSSWADTAQTTRPQRFVKAVMRRFAGGRNVMLAVGSGAEPPAPGMGWVFSTALTQAELDAIRPDVDRGLGRPPKLVAIGRLSSEKGVHVLLRAIARLKGTPAGDARLEILGDGPARSALEQECRALGLDDRISFKGYLNRPELSAALQDADLCVHPALTESLSKAWLDAMAHGVPVLSTNVGVAPMVMGRAGERGWLVPPGDDRALANGIVAALDHAAAWPDLRRRCRTFVESYTLERWASDIGRFCAAQWGGQLTEGRLRL
ncbi:MAG: glycosyltransferase family 4 protein [Acidobacteria bacterium]|nr:glycosyltransferase family 4 protein [Acidobacteriota bacterium]